MNLALFDFDGTITDADTWTPFVRLTATSTRTAIGSIALLPVAVAYRLKLMGGGHGQAHRRNGGLQRAF
jgi:hypothetical protein